MITSALRDTRLLWLTISMVLLAGYFSFESLPRMEDPVLTERAAMINTSVPGASARRVEALVSQQLVKNLRLFEEVKEVRSISRPNISSITVTLHDEIKDVDEVWARVRDKLSDVSPLLPSDSEEPVFEIIRVRAYASIVGVTWNSPRPPIYSILNRFARSFEEEVRSLPNTDKVDVFGNPQEEITLRVDQSALQRMGLTVEELSRQLQASDSKLPAGLLRNRNQEVLLEVGGEFDSLKRIGRIPIQSLATGQTSYVSDVAEVEKGIKQPADCEAYVDEKPAILIASSPLSQTRIDHWNRGLQACIEEFQKKLPPDLKLIQVFNQEKYVSARINYLVRDLFFSALAVFLVVWLMMGWRSACVVGMALPLSSCIVFAVFRMIGIPLHQMSLSGLVIALGMLEGTAIIVVDDIQRRIRGGQDIQAAIAKGTSHLAAPLFGSTATTILSFLPIATMPGPSGEFVGTIGTSVILALCASLVLSFTVIPQLTAMFAGKRSQKQTWMANGFYSDRLNRAYEWSLHFFIGRPWMTVLIGVVSSALGLVAIAVLPVQFFPSADRDQLHLELELSTTASLHETRSVSERVQKILESHPSILRVDWVLGRNAPSFYYNMIGTRKDTPNFAEALILLKPTKDIPKVVDELQRTLDDSITDAQVRLLALEQGPPYNAPIEIRIYGDQEKQLREYGEKVRALLATNPQVRSTQADLTDYLPKLVYRFDESESRLIHLPLAAIAQQLQTSIEGSTGGSILEGNETLPVRVRLSDEDRGDLEQIERIGLVGSNVAMLTSSPSLSALGAPTLQAESAVVSRIDGYQINEIRAWLSPNVLPSVVLADIQKVLEQSENKPPPGCRIEYAGESSKRTEAVGQLVGNVLLLIAAAIFVLVFSLRSFRATGIIFAIGGLSFGWALWSLWAVQYPLGFTAIVGAMGMVGIAINDSIVVLAELRSDEGCQRGKIESIVELVSLSTRHVLCTTFTVGCSFIPMLLEGGTFWPPMAIVVIGGVFGATALALYWIPAIHLVTLSRVKSE